MALIHCKECGKEISDTAKVCLNCGAKTEKTKQQDKKIRNIIIVFAIILVILGIVFVIKINNPLHKYSREAISILEDFKNDKLTSSQAYKEIKKIHSKVESNYKENNNAKYFSLSINLNGALISLSSDNYSDINEDIKNLKKY